MLPIQFHASLQLYLYAVLAYFLHKQFGACRLQEMALKVLPILTLVFVLTQRRARTKYSQLVRKALLWSALGDALLVFLDNDVCALLGAASFAVAHLQYRRAFQLDASAESPLSGLLTCCCLPALLLLGSGHSFLLACLAKCYMVYLFFVMSKAFNKFWHVEQARSHAAVFGLVGAFFFIVSDIVLLSKELSASREGSRFVIMATYYVGQFGLAASAL